MTLICRACPRCNGDCCLEQDVHGKFWSCLQCGNEISPEEMEVFIAVKEKQTKQEPLTLPAVPPKPEPGVKGYNSKMRKYHEANKRYILDEIKKVGEKATRARWGILSPTWTGLKRRWGMPIQKRNGHKTLEGLHNVAALPSFPAFRESWGDKVKIAWLAAYAEVFSSQGGKQN